MGIMESLARLLLLCGLLLTSCGPTAEQTAAVAAFEQFQDALFSGDKSSVRRLLTRESQPIAAHMPWDRVQSQQRLEPLGCEYENGRYHVLIRDPNRGNRKSRYIVVRESSAWRVDLIESTRWNRTETNLPGPPTKLVPRELSPREIDEITAREASMSR